MIIKQSMQNKSFSNLKPSKKLSAMSTVIYKRFILKMGLLTLFILVACASLFSTILAKFYFVAFPYQLLLIATVTTIGHFWIIKASEESSQKFTTAFMASVTMKLLIYIFFMLIYLWFDHSQVYSFLLNFFSLYLIYTIFEVFEVLNFIKKNQKTALKD